MTDKYTGTTQDKRYTGEALDITFAPKRCIHAKECITRLAAVFDIDKRPWINADGAPADAAAEVIHSCPSGALHYERKDGGASEPIPEANTVTLWANGPLQITGDLTIQGATVDMATETRVTLCRCGASDQKPFCNNAHLQMRFVAEDVAPKAVKEAATGGKLTITATPNGPLELVGHVEIVNADGETVFAGGKTYLCRCGASSSKPFCDGTHAKVGFEAE